MSWFSRYVVDPIAAAFSGEDDGAQRRREDEAMRRERLKAETRAASDREQVTRAASQSMALEEQRASQARLEETQNALLMESRKATDEVVAAAVPVRDSEPARRSSERKARQLQAGAFNSRARTFGAPPVGFRSLSGS